MHYTALDRWDTIPTIFRVSRQVIKQQRQLLIVVALALRVITLGTQRGLENTIGPEMTAQLQAAEGGSPSELLTAVDRSALTPHLPLLGLWGIAMILVYLLVHVTLTLKIFATIEEKNEPLTDTLAHAWRKLWPYIWTSILQTICLLWLFLLLIIPGLIFAVYRYFTLYVVLYHHKSGMSALQESKAIVQGRWRKTLGYMLLIWLIAALIIMAVSWLIGIGAQLVGDTMIAEQLAQIFSNFLQVCIVVVLVVFFLRRDKTRVAQSLHQS